MSLSINGIPVRSIARSFGLNTLVSASYIQNCHPSHLPGTPFAVTVHVGDCRTFTVVLACKVSQELDTDVVLASDWKIALRELFFSLGEPVPAFFDPWLLFLPSVPLAVHPRLRRSFVVPDIINDFVVAPAFEHKARTYDHALEDDARTYNLDTSETLSHHSTSNDDFDVSFVNVSTEQKKTIVQIIMHYQQPTVQALRAMATRHLHMSATYSHGMHKTAQVLRSEFLAHDCSESCVILQSEYLLAGIHPPSPAPTESEPSLVHAGMKRKSSCSLNDTRKASRLSFETMASSAAFPILLSQDDKDDIVSEFRAATGNDALRRHECSFCGKLEAEACMKKRKINELDISLLDVAVAELRSRSCQPRIEAFRKASIVDGSYVLCHLCNSAVKRNAFVSIPLRSYANGLWIGEVPEELEDLTFLEEQCIARARATKCMYKLTLGPSGQFAARGNVCILPQDTASVLPAMPVPLFQLRDETCVILVGSSHVEVTHDMLKRSPLLVRRHKLKKALFWLIENNPLYMDLKKDTVLANLEEYPVYDCPLATTSFLRTNSANNQGSSYTSYTTQANAELFGGTDNFELTSTTLVDVDNMDSTYQQRKLEALRRLKNQDASFVKFPSGSVPLSTSKNPRVFGWLWPTLFPYGVGMIDNNNIRISTDIPYHQVDTLSHVQHMLNIADRRFQVHKSFIFVMSNILQRRQSSFKARLATNRSWFPIVQDLMQKIDTDSMETFQTKLEKNPFAKPETVGEKAAVKVMKYLNYVSDHVPGSVGNVNNMKHQIHSKIVCDGLPHFFATVNPADSHNPIAQVLAGRDINLQKIFDAIGHAQNEPSLRAKTLAENPVAGAEFFHLMITKFLDIILGTKRVSKIGILGKVKGWYAVVESQVRGSLHLHILIWIDGAPSSPLDMKDRMNSDPVFKQKLTAWYDDLICQSFPKNSVPYTAAENTPKQLPVLSRPLNPASPDYIQRRDQQHRDLCETTGLVHEHNATCFKHIPRRIHALLDPDSDCRFGLPRPLASHTHFDEDGDLVIRCENGDLNGHNPTVTLCLGCNNDLKQTASGSVAMAMVEYMANYTVKLQLDTSIVYSALCASIKALQDKPPEDVDGNVDNAEMARLMLVKTTNTLVGKRELSGQQTASFLLGRKNNYTSDVYHEYWWSSMLRDIARDVFTFDFDQHRSTELDDDSEENELENQDMENTECMIIPDDEDDNMIVLTVENINTASTNPDSNVQDKKYSTLFNDIFYRPPELNCMCVWDLLRQFIKVKKPKSQTQRKTFLWFKPGHPQYTTHCLHKLDDSAIPVLMGYRIPRNDSGDDEVKYAVVILTLFKPWSNDKSSPLKESTISWLHTFKDFKQSLSPEYYRVMLNMQLLYQTRDAKFDFAARRVKRLADLKMKAKVAGFPEDDIDEYDPIWENAMQTDIDSDEIDTENIQVVKETAATRDAKHIVLEATHAGFYSVENLPSSDVHEMFNFKVTAGDETDVVKASIAATELLKEKDRLIKSRVKAIQNDTDNLDRGCNLFQVSERVPYALRTSLKEEDLRAREVYESFHSPNSEPCPGSPWLSLLPYQRLCLALIVKHTLNDEQTRTFLLLADKIGRELQSGRKDPPMSLLCTGPGGAGKSVIFRAWKDFYDITGHPERMCLTAPTGVVASDIGGCTIHSEASLRILPAQMKSTPALRANLEERISPLQTLVLDEVYFLSAQDLGQLSEYLCMAKGVTDSICGGLNWATCGDPCQLPPPGGNTLFDRALVQCHNDNILNDLHDNVRRDVKGIQIWHQVEHVVVLQEIMRQKDDLLLIDILKRLRMGTCTAQDKAILDTYVLSSPDCSMETKNLTNIERWIDDPERACPLIVYTNAARDQHNSNMAEAFAAATGQQCHVYHSSDTRGRGRKKHRLTGLAAEAAWSLPAKNTKDLCGKVHYIPGMSVFCTENLATELGISNGSPGILVSIVYEEIDGRRYAISADVDFRSYKNSDTTAPHPHRVTLKPFTKSIRFHLPNSEKTYSATRSQLPLIPAFAFTAHNAQGRSLDRCCIDLASSPVIQCAYVMLSRVRSLQGLCILRPFNVDRIQNHISQELRAELERTKLKAEKTKTYSREHLSWFYNVIPEGQVKVLTQNNEIFHS